MASSASPRKKYISYSNIQTYKMPSLAPTFKIQQPSSIRLSQHILSNQEQLLEQFKEKQARRSSQETPGLYPKNDLQYSIRRSQNFQLNQGQTRRISQEDLAPLAIPKRDNQLSFARENLGYYLTQTAGSIVKNTKVDKNSIDLSPLATRNKPPSQQQIILFPNRNISSSQNQTQFRKQSSQPESIYDGREEQGVPLSPKKLNNFIIRSQSPVKISRPSVQRFNSQIVSTLEGDQFNEQVPSSNKVSWQRGSLIRLDSFISQEIDPNLKPKELSYISSRRKCRSQTQDSLNNMLPSLPNTLSPTKEGSSHKLAFVYSNEVRNSDIIDNRLSQGVVQNSRELKGSPIKRTFFDEKTKSNDISQFKMSSNSEENQLLSHSWNELTREKFGEDIKSALEWTIEGNNKLMEVALNFPVKEAKTPKNSEQQQQEQQGPQSSCVNSLAAYLSRFACYVADLTLGEVPKTVKWRKSYRFKVLLEDYVLDSVSSCIFNKAKELGLSDVLPIFKVIFREEFCKQMKSKPLANEFSSEIGAQSVAKMFLDRLSKYYKNSFAEYLPLCQKFIGDLITEQDLYECIHSIQCKIFSELHAPTNSVNGEDQIEVISKENLFFAKQSLYESFKQQIQSLSASSSARILEILELLRFQYFKESYGISSDIKLRMVAALCKCIQHSPPLMQYFQKKEAQIQIKQFFTFLAEALLGEMTLAAFLAKSLKIIGFEIDLFFITTIEQVVKGFLEQTELKTLMQCEIEHKFIHLKRRAKVIPSFSSAFYLINEAAVDISNWMGLMQKNKQVKIDNNESTDYKNKMDFLEYFLTCALADYDAFSLHDFQLGLHLYSISKAEFAFWVKGVRRVFLKLRLRQTELNYLCDYLIKCYSQATNEL